jgi:multisubunit Na+/H+ antiporter MnhC subunit
MSNPSYRALRIILGIFSVFTAAAGLLIVFNGKPLVRRVLLHPPALMLAVLFFFASRDPVRNVAVVNALIVGLCILAMTPLLSLYTLDIRRLYPSYLI